MTLSLDPGLLQPTGHLEAGHISQRNVEDDEIGLEARSLLKNGSAIGQSSDDGALGLQQVTQRLQNLRIVVSQQEPYRAHEALSPPAPLSATGGLLLTKLPTTTEAAYWQNYYFLDEKLAVTGRLRERK